MTAMDEIYNIRPEERKPFAVTPEFIKVFNALGELDSYRDKETENGGGWASLGAVLADESYSGTSFLSLMSLTSSLTSDTQPIETGPYGFRARVFSNAVGSPASESSSCSTPLPIFLS